MFKKVIRLVLKCILFCFITVLTQIGGIIYFFVELFIPRNQKHYRLKKLIVFLSAYTVLTFWVVPYIAPVFGREKIKDNSQISARNVLIKFMNRDYVTPQLHIVLQQVANSLQKTDSKISLVYLDANFPFFDGFPLVPHLSHNDGEKIDISFIYTDQDLKIINKKPSISGYGIFEAPLEKEYDQNKVCKQKGYWQYDFTKYVTLGTINSKLKFSKKGTKTLLLSILNQKEIGAVFLEPHLKNRLNLKNSKVKFHGCHAVRHDDHIHIQLKKR